MAQEIEQLILSYLEGRSSDEEQAQLETALNENPDHVDRLVLHAEDQVDLEAFFKEAVSESKQPVAGLKPKTARKSSSSRSRAPLLRENRRKESSWVRTLLSAAAIVLVMGIPAYLLLKNSSNQTNQPQAGIQDRNADLVKAKAHVLWAPEGPSDNGPSIVLRKDGTKTALRKGMPLFAGDQVQTGSANQHTAKPAYPAARATIKWADMRVDLASETFLNIAPALENDPAFQLNKGLVYVEAEQNLLANAEWAELALEAEGGRFELMRDEGQVRIRVETDSIRLSNTFGRQQVGRLQESVVLANAAPSAPATIFATALWRGRKGPLKETQRPNPGPVQRVTEDLLALYTFQSGSGNLIRDVSGVDKPIHLHIKDPKRAQWMAGGGLTLTGKNWLYTDPNPRRILEAGRQRLQFTIEAWAAPKGYPNQLALPMTFGLGDPGFMPPKKGILEQHRMRIAMYPKSLDASRSGLAHLTLTRLSSGKIEFHINGEFDHKDSEAPENLRRWKDWYKFFYRNVLADGKAHPVHLYLIAVYGRALEAKEINQNYRAGISHVRK